MIDREMTARKITPSFEEAAREPLDDIALFS